ncbi:hypothetical protein ACS0TY_023927 [Phlomoides rotata]
MMVYRWPHSLLKKVDMAMRNFLWKGDIAKKSTSCTIAWSKCCAPQAEGGLGIRSIKVANESFVCKFAWDILRNDSEELGLLNRRYIKMDGTPKTSNRSLSLWRGIRRHWPRLLEGSRWIVSSHSLLSFWIGNWLDYVIADRIGIPPNYAAIL